MMKETHLFMDYLKTIQNENELKNRENEKFLDDYRQKCNQSERQKQKEFREKLRASTKVSLLKICICMYIRKKIEFQKYFRQHTSTAGIK